MECSGSQRIDWMYPNIYPTHGARDRLTVSLFHTRAANSIAIEFDSERNGWLIFMQPTKDLAGVMDDDGPEREVAFIPAWISAAGEDLG